MKNKLIAILLTAVLAISTTACGNAPADRASGPADAAEQSGDRESSQEEPAGDSLEETTEELAEETEEEPGGEEPAGDGKSFAYMMDDNWYEPDYYQFLEMRDTIGAVTLDLEYGMDIYEKMKEWDEGDEVINSIIRRWEEESYEAQGSYTWEQFMYDIYTEYDAPMPYGEMCKIGDSHWVFALNDNERGTLWRKWVVDNWYDKYVHYEFADNLESLAEQIGVDTSSNEFCIIFRLYMHSLASQSQIGFLLTGDEILAEYNDIKEQFAGDGESETQNGKSFTYVMADGWYEPFHGELDNLAYDIEEDMLSLESSSQSADEQLQEGDGHDKALNDIISRWEEKSYEGQGSYTWEQFEYDIRKEYNVPMPNGEMCKIGDSYRYRVLDSEGVVQSVWVVDDWYDRYVYDSCAEYFEELAERVDIDTSSDAFCGIFRRILNTCVSRDGLFGIEMSIEPADEKEILAEFGIE